MTEIMKSSHVEFIRECQSSDPVGKIILEGIEHSTARHMINFLQFGRIVLTEGIVRKLLVAADRFMVDNLKKRCEYFLVTLMAQCNVQTHYWGINGVLRFCIDLYNFAMEHNASYLSRNCLFWAFEYANDFLGNEDRKNLKVNPKPFNPDAQSVSVFKDFITKSTHHLGEMILEMEWSVRDG